MLAKRATSDIRLAGTAKKKLATDLDF